MEKTPRTYIWGGGAEPPWDEPYGPFFTPVTTEIITISSIDRGFNRELMDRPAPRRPRRFVNLVDALRPDEV